MLIYFCSKHPGDFGYTNEYQQPKFLLKTERNRYHCKPQFYNINVGFRGRVFLMFSKLNVAVQYGRASMVFNDHMALYRRVLMVFNEHMAPFRRVSTVFNEHMASYIYRRTSVIFNNHTKLFILENSF